MADELAESNSPPVGGSATVAAPRDAIKPIAAGLFGAGLTALAIGGLVFVIKAEPVNSLGFNALVGTAILSIGLIALIVLSRAVGVSEPTAALGLPPGSIRALLALGLAIVFVSVASWSLGGLFDPLGAPLDQSTISPGEEEKYRKGFTPETDFVFAIVPTPKAADNVPRLTAKAYLKKKAPDTALLDLAKQILTITATVLVTVVGFYFGSNSSSEAVRNLRETLTELHGGGGSASSADVADLQKTMQQIDAINAGAKSKLTELGSDPIAPLAAAVKAAGPNKELEDRLGVAQKALSDCKSAAERCVASAAKAKELFGAVRANAAAPELMQTNVQLRQHLTEAEQANRQFEKHLADFGKARDAITRG